MKINKQKQEKKVSPIVIPRIQKASQILQNIQQKYFNWLVFRLVRNRLSRWINAHRVPYEVMCRPMCFYYLQSIVPQLHYIRLYGLIADFRTKWVVADNLRMYPAALRVRTKINYLYKCRRILFQFFYKLRVMLYTKKLKKLLPGLIRLCHALKISNKNFNKLKDGRVKILLRLRLKSLRRLVRKLFNKPLTRIQRVKLAALKMSKSLRHINTPKAVNRPLRTSYKPIRKAKRNNWKNSYDNTQNLIAETIQRVIETLASKQLAESTPKNSSVVNPVVQAENKATDNRQQGASSSTMLANKKIQQNLKHKISIVNEPQKFSRKSAVDAYIAGRHPMQVKSGVKPLKGNSVIHKTSKLFYSQTDNSEQLRKEIEKQQALYREQFKKILGNRTDSILPLSESFIKAQVLRREAIRKSAGTAPVMSQNPTNIHSKQAPLSQKTNRKQRFPKKRQYNIKRAVPFAKIKIGNKLQVLELPIKPQPVILSQKRYNLLAFLFSCLHARTLAKKRQRFSVPYITKYFSSFFKTKYKFKRRKVKGKVAKIALTRYNILKKKSFRKYSKILLLRSYLKCFKTNTLQLNSFFTRPAAVLNRFLYYPSISARRNTFILLLDMLDMQLEHHVPITRTAMKFKYADFLDSLDFLFTRLKRFNIPFTGEEAWQNKIFLPNHDLAMMVKQRRLWKWNPQKVTIKKRSVKFRKWRVKKIAKLFLSYKRRKLSRILRKRRINIFYKFKLLRKIKSKYLRLRSLGVERAMLSYLRVLRRSYFKKRINRRFNLQKMHSKRLSVIALKTSSQIKLFYILRTLLFPAKVYPKYIRAKNFITVYMKYSIPQYCKLKKSQFLMFPHRYRLKDYRSRQYFNKFWPHTFKSSILLVDWSQFLFSTFLNFVNDNTTQVLYKMRYTRAIVKKYKRLFKQYTLIIQQYYKAIYHFKYAKKVPPHSILKRVRQFEKLRGFKKLPKLSMHNARWNKHNKFFDWLKFVRDKKSFFKMKIVLDRLFNWVYGISNINYIFGTYFHKVTLSNYLFQTRFMYMKTHKFRIV